MKSLNNLFLFTALILLFSGCQKTDISQPAPSTQPSSLKSAPTYGPVGFGINVKDHLNNEYGYAQVFRKVGYNIIQSCYDGGSGENGQVIDYRKPIWQTRTIPFVANSYSSAPAAASFNGHMYVAFCGLYLVVMEGSYTSPDPIDDTWTTNPITNFKTSPSSGVSIYISNNQLHILCTGEDGSIWEVWGNAGQQGLSCQNLSQKVPNAPKAKGQPFGTANGSQCHVVYRDVNDKISDIWFDGSWKYQNLSDKAGTSTPLANGDPSPIFYGNQQHVTYLDKDGKISDLWYGGGWKHQNLNNLVPGSPLPAGNPFCAIMGTSNDQMHVFYRDKNGSISDLWYKGGWKHQNLNYLAPSSSNAISDPFVYKGGTSFTQTHVIFNNTNGRISDIYYDGTWKHQLN